MSFDFSASNAAANSPAPVSCMEAGRPAGRSQVAGNGGEIRAARRVAGVEAAPAGPPSARSDHVASAART